LGTRLASAAPLNNGVSAASILVSLMSAIEQRESGSYTLGGTKRNNGVRDNFRKKK
jgi:hypothetical protein